jgi:hypothetical protein
MAERIRAVLRANEWWDYKLVPILTFYYATAHLLGVGVAELWSGALILLVSLLPGAAYVSIINDLTDIEDDLAAGKRNRMAGRSAAFKTISVLLTVSAGAIFFWLWRGEPLLLAFYGAAWISFTLYSVRPVRLKARGLAGVIADGCGAHVFPTLLAVTLAFVSAERPVDPVWLAAAAAWAVGYGLRGNLWHQLLDRESDLQSGVNTFAGRHPPHIAARLGTWIAFPLEVAGLVVLLLMLDSLLPVLALCFHVLLSCLRVGLWQIPPVIVDPKPRFFIVLHEYYDVFLPVSLLIASSLAHPADGFVLAAHLLLFHRRTITISRNALELIGKAAKLALQRRSPHSLERAAAADRDAESS